MLFNMIRVNVFFPCVLVISFLVAEECSAQSPEKEVHHREQLWFGYFNQTRISNRFGLWVDIHYRQTDNFVERPFQFLFRPAVTYFIKDNLRFNVGYAFVNHFPAGRTKDLAPRASSWQHKSRGIKDTRD